MMTMTLSSSVSMGRALSRFPLFLPFSYLKRMLATHVSYKVNLPPLKPSQKPHSRPGVTPNENSDTDIDTESSDKIKHETDNKGIYIQNFVNNELELFIQKSYDSTKDSLKTSPPHPVGAILELTIKSISHGGQGIALHDNWIYIVPFVALNETIQCQVQIHIMARASYSYSVCNVVKILTPSPARVTPVCKYFSQCSGCHFQHISYEEQLLYKHRTLKIIFEPIMQNNPDIILHPVHPSPMQYYYRTKMTPHFNRPSIRDSHIPIGMNDYQGNLIDLEQCPIVTPEINHRYTLLRREVQSRKDFYINGATLLLRRSFPGPSVKTSSNEIATEIVSGVSFRFNAGSFFQSNPPVVEACIGIIKKVLQEARISLNIPYLLDIYCG